MAIPSPGWAIEIVGERIDLDDLRELLAPPFDPWVEDFEDEERGTLLLLRSKSWVGVEDSGIVLSQGTKMIERLNGAELLVFDDARPVAMGQAMRFGDDGVRVPIIIAATGHFTMRGGRMRGRGVVISDELPPPPKASQLQEWLQAADTDDDRADLFEHIARADNWYDLYKTAEIVRRLAGTQAALKSALGADLGEWERAWWTANTNRHAPDPVKYRPPPVPSTIEEARRAIFKAAKLFA